MSGRAEFFQPCFIDPALPVRCAVLTHAHGDHARQGSAEYHAAAPGLGLLRWRLGEPAGLRLVLAGAQPFRHWDGVMFELEKPA